MSKQEPRYTRTTESIAAAVGVKPSSIRVGSVLNLCVMVIILSAQIHSG